MATIEERAREYAKGRKYEIIAYVAYIAGAIGQKDIDIDKACKWIKENVECGVHPQSAYGFVDMFRKAMEEK